MIDIVERLTELWAALPTLRQRETAAEAAAEIGKLRAALDVEGAMVAFYQRNEQIKKAEIEKLRAALSDALIGINHVALYKTDTWPEPGTDHMEALERIGAGQSYDLWCCWNAGMQAYRVLEGK